MPKLQLDELEPNARKIKDTTSPKLTNNKEAMQKLKKRCSKKYARNSKQQVSHSSTLSKAEATGLTSTMVSEAKSISPGKRVFSSGKVSKTTKKLSTGSGGS